MNKMVLLYVISMCLFTIIGYTDEHCDMPSGLKVDFIATNYVPIGSNVQWALIITNSTPSSKTIIARMEINSLLWNQGTIMGNIVLLEETNIINGYQTYTISYTIPPTNYVQTIGDTNIYDCQSSIYVCGTTDYFSSAQATYLGPNENTNILTILPSNVVVTGVCVTAVVNIINTMAIPIHNVKARIIGDGEFNNIANAYIVHDFNLGTVNTNDIIYAKTNFIATGAGTSSIAAEVRMSEYPEIISTQMEIIITMPE